MALAMIGPHSAVRNLVGASMLLLLAMALARFARSDRTVAGHVVDCFAMGAGLAVAMANPVDATVQGHAHASGLAVPGLAALMAVAAVWTMARVALLVSSPSRPRMTLAGAALTAAGFALMLTMS